MLRRRAGRHLSGREARRRPAGRPSQSATRRHHARRRREMPGLGCGQRVRHGTPLPLGTRSRHGRRARGAPLHGARQRQIRGPEPSHRNAPLRRGKPRSGQRQSAPPPPSPRRSVPRPIDRKPGQHRSALWRPRLHRPRRRDARGCAPIRCPRKLRRRRQPAHSGRRRRRCCDAPNRPSPSPIADRKPPVLWAVDADGYRPLRTAPEAALPVCPPMLQKLAVR
jgi:hypothetical protein